MHFYSRYAGDARRSPAWANCHLSNCQGAKPRALPLLTKHLYILKVSLPAADFTKKPAPPPAGGSVARRRRCNRTGVCARGSVAESKDSRPPTLILPSAAVLRQGKEAFCNRLIGGKATKAAVQLGIKVGDDFELTGGLKDNDTVILNKASSLTDGQAVEVLKAAAK